MNNELIIRHIIAHHVSITSAMIELGFCLNYLETDDFLIKTNSSIVVSVHVEKTIVCIIEMLHVLKCHAHKFLT